MALKIASRDVIHKKARGALEINVNTPDQAKSSFKNIIFNVRKNNKKAEVEGVLYQPMAKAGGVEVIIGMKRDSNFGPMIMFGLGGSHVELLKDVAFRIAPVNKNHALAQMAEIKTFPAIKDYDTDLLAEMLVKISHLAMDFPQIQEIDLNPVMVYKKGASIIDVRIML